MRFGILNREEEIALAREKVPDFEGLCVGVVRKLPPDTDSIEELAIWVLESLGIVNGAKPDHAAVTILLELVRRRREGKGTSGSELTSLTKIGKTQTYYWLGRMKDAGLVDQGKKKLIEHGAIRIMSGFYLKGPNLSYTVADVKKRVEGSFDEIIGVSEKLQDNMKRAETINPEALADAEAAELEIVPETPEPGLGEAESPGDGAIGTEPVETEPVETGLPESEQIETELPEAELPETEPSETEPPKAEPIQQPDSKQTSQQSGSPELSE